MTRGISSERTLLGVLPQDPIKLAAVSLIMTPEECSSEIIKLCFGYLPEEIRGGRKDSFVNE